MSTYLIQHIPNFREIIEILVLSVCFYYMLLYLRGTRGAQVLTGMLLFLAAFFVITRFLHMDNLNWIIKQLSVYLGVAFIIIFQPEIRRALAAIGRQSVFASSFQRGEKGTVDSIIKTVSLLADKKIGALIAIEREIELRAVSDTGCKVDALISPELLTSIFFPSTPLHDGGVVIRGDRLLAAACVYPLTQRAELSKSLGTRHRAAIGLTEETDALVVVVSEETGGISLAYKGRLSRGLDEERLRRLLASIMARKTKEKPGWALKNST